MECPVFPWYCVLVVRLLRDVALFGTFLTRFVSVDGCSLSPAHCWRGPSCSLVNCHEGTGFSRRSAITFSHFDVRQMSSSRPSFSILNSALSQQLSRFGATDSRLTS